MRSSKNTWGKIVFSILIAAIIFMLLKSELSHSSSRAIDIFKEAGYENTTATIYLRNRMLDTVFEVLVFSLVVVGLMAYHSSHAGGVKEMEDVVFKNVARLVAFFLFVASFYLASTGHVFPGGGFTAGVTGGTALLMVGMAKGFERFEKDFERFKVDKVEKILVGVIAAVAFLEFKLGHSGFIILQNILIYFKVMAGTWIIAHNLMKHRGIV